MWVAAVALGCAAEGLEPGPTPPSSTSSPDPGPSQPGPEPEPSPTPKPSPTPEPSHEGIEVPSPPADLVGSWNGGPGDSSDWYLTIRHDGAWSLVNDVLGLSDSGVVDTSGQGFEMYNASGDARVVDAAGVNGCPWSIRREAGMTFLWFCEGQLGPLSSWAPVG